MKYLLLCQVQPAAFADVPEEIGAKIRQDMSVYHHQLIQAGVLMASGQLAPPDTAQRVFSSHGHIKAQDGPALAGDTQIGGFYLLDVPGEAEATDRAAKCPVAQFASLEVRAVAYSPLCCF
jgi:hypothetical protein